MRVEGKIAEFPPIRLQRGQVSLSTIPLFLSRVNGASGIEATSLSWGVDGSRWLGGMVPTSIITFRSRYLFNKLVALWDSLKSVVRTNYCVLLVQRFQDRQDRERDQIILGMFNPRVLAFSKDLSDKSSFNLLMHSGTRSSRKKARRDSELKKKGNLDVT